MYVYIHIWTPESKYECLLAVYSLYTYVQGAARILSYLESESRYEHILTCIQSRCCQDTFVFGCGVQVRTYIHTNKSSYTVAFHVMVFISLLFSYNLADLIRRTLTPFS